MSNIKAFLHGYSLLNTLQQSTLNSISKCSISSSNNDKNNMRYPAHAAEATEASRITDYLKTKSIRFCQGWNNLNIYSCPKAQDSFFINNKTGFLNIY